MSSCPFFTPHMHLKRDLPVITLYSVAEEWLNTSFIRTGDKIYILVDRTGDDWT